ncbi:MAG: alpha/beta hydrolase [Tatlockia sp.]|jgi:pimeloyl-ACP methyl ester carboxylesterase
MNNKTTSDRLSMTLPDGRQLGFAEFGSPDGTPILYFHGLPGSRLEARHLQNVALLNHYRLIGIDRPGMGLSSVHLQRSILSWVDDVESFADYLGLKKFSIIGHSGGAPFVAACAYKIPNRLNGVAIVSGMAPFEIPEATASLARGQRFINKAIQAMPWVVTVMVKLMSMMLKKPAMQKQMLKQLPEVDQRVFRDSGSNQAFIGATLEAFRHGVVGVSQEIRLTLKPWGFDIANIKCPVTIWQGSLDKQAPEVHAKLYAKLIPNAKLTFFKNDGHLSLLLNHGEEILRSICP